MCIANVVYDLLVNGVFGFTLFKIPQRLCQVIVQDHCLVPKLSNEKIFLLNLFLERQSSFELLPH